jgi:hypothetical protein
MFDLSHFTGGKADDFLIKRSLNMIISQNKHSRIKITRFNRRFDELGIYIYIFLLINHCIFKGIEIQNY